MPNQVQYLWLYRNVINSGIWVSSESILNKIDWKLKTYFYGVIFIQFYQLIKAQLISKLICIRICCLNAVLVTDSAGKSRSTFSNHLYCLPIAAELQEKKFLFSKWHHFCIYFQGIHISFIYVFDCSFWIGAIENKIKHIMNHFPRHLRNLQRFLHHLFLRNKVAFSLNYISNLSLEYDIESLRPF